jgi:hypothetical protein
VTRTLAARNQNDSRVGSVPKIGCGRTAQGMPCAYEDFPPFPLSSPFPPAGGEGGGALRAGNLRASLGQSLPLRANRSPSGRETRNVGEFGCALIVRRCLTGPIRWCQ